MRSAFHPRVLEGLPAHKPLAAMYRGDTWPHRVCCRDLHMDSAGNTDGAALHGEVRPVLVWCGHVGGHHRRDAAARPAALHQVGEAEPFRHESGAVPPSCRAGFLCRLSTLSVPVLRLANVAAGCRRSARRRWQIWWRSAWMRTPRHAPLPRRWCRCSASRTLCWSGTCPAGGHGRQTPRCANT